MTGRIIYECRVAINGSSSSSRRKMPLLDAGAISVRRRTALAHSDLGLQSDSVTLVRVR